MRRSGSRSSARCDRESPPAPGPQFLRHRWARRAGCPKPDATSSTTAATRDGRQRQPSRGLQPIRLVDRGRASAAGASGKGRAGTETWLQSMPARAGGRRASQCPKGGSCRSNTTRLAGFEMGRTKLAALAISAHASRCGRGSTLARRSAASTAGVITTAVASFESSAVTTTPATVDPQKQPRRRPAAHGAPRDRRPSRRRLPLAPARPAASFR